MNHEPIHLLIISRGFAPWGGPISIRATQLAKEAISRGWKVSVCCTKIRCAHVSDDNDSFKSVSSAKIFRFSDGTDYLGRNVIEKFIGFNYAKVIDKLIFAGEHRWRRNCLKACKFWNDAQRPNVIFSTCPVATAADIGIELSKKWGLPWITDFRDPPWEKLTKGQLTLHLEQCEKAVLNTPRAADFMHSLFPAYSPKIEYQTNGVNSQDAEMKSIGPPKLNRSIIYAGGIYPCLVNVLEKLQNAGFNVYVYGFVEEKRAKEIFKLKNLGITFRPPVPADEVVTEMKKFESVLAHFPNNCEHRISFKTYLAIASGRPVLLSGKSDGAFELFAKTPGLIDLNTMIDTNNFESSLSEKINGYDLEHSINERRRIIVKHTWREIFNGIFDKYIPAGPDTR